jgi:hypothetical protein
MTKNTSKNIATEAINTPATSGNSIKKTSKMIAKCILNSE